MDEERKYSAPLPWEDEDLAAARKAVAAMILCGLSTEEISIALGCQEHEAVALAQDEAVYEYRSSMLNQLLLKDQEMNLKSFVNVLMKDKTYIAALMLDDFMRGRTPPGVIRPYDPIVKVDNKTRLRAVMDLIRLGISMKQIGDEEKLSIEIPDVKEDFEAIEL